MTIAEFMVLVCNFNSNHVSTEAKKTCAEYYANCAIKDSNKVDTFILATCKAKRPSL